MPSSPYRPPPKQPINWTTTAVLLLALLILVLYFFFLLRLPLSGEAKIALLCGGLLVVLAFTIGVQVRDDRARRIDALLRQGMTPDDARLLLDIQADKIRRQGRTIFLSAGGLTVVIVLGTTGLYLAEVSIERCIDIAMIGLPIGLLGMLRGISQMVSGVEGEKDP